MNKRQVCTLLVGLAAVAAPAFGQNIATNGSFETPSYSDGVNWPVPVTGWTIGPDSGFEVWTNNGPAADGAQFIELDVNTCDTISQTLTTVSGIRYSVRYAYSARPGVVDNRVEVRWNGQLISSASANGTGLTNPSWIYYSTEVQATGTSTALTFANVDACDGVGSFLDDVSVTEIEPVPALGGGGLLALAAMLAVVGCAVLWTTRSLRA
jgi:hypothetical protein